MSEINFDTKKTRSTYFTSIVFLIAVIFITICLYFYNNYLFKDIEKIKLNIVNIESSIKEVEKDKNLQVYSLLEINKKVISSYEKMNDISKYINHMNVISWKYNLKFEWFEFSKWELTSNVNIVSDDKWIAYSKTKEFIEKYRNDAKALFDLGFVNSIEWMDDINFKVTFKIK